jgi:hypothetical protein
VVGAPLKQLVRSGARLVVIDPGVPSSLRLPDVHLEIAMRIKL